MGRGGGNVRLAHPGAHLADRAFGLLATTPAGANSLSLIPEFLPLISSAFVPTASMPAGVRWFAQNEPFTPVIDTLRGLLSGTPIGARAAAAVAWCLGVAVAGYLSARALYNRGTRYSPGER